MDITTRVIEILKSYQGNKRKIELLKYELENPPRLSDDEIISSLALGSSASNTGAVGGNTVSDKTMMIAMRFRDTGERLMDEALLQIMQELNALEAEVKRIEHYLSLLPEKLSTVIKLFYFDGLQYAQISEQLGVSTATVTYRKNAAIKELASMYQFLYGIKEDVPE